MIQLLSTLSIASTLFLGIAVPFTDAYSLTESYAGQEFADKFNFITHADPTHGHVKYVPKDQALGEGLMTFDNGKARIGMDTKSQAPEGRKSVRIESQRKYTKGLFILDAEHMPSACGAWPAFWTFGDGWPDNGEIDIIEGVHLDDMNQSALHTKDGCTTADNSAAGLDTGRSKSTNCDVGATGNVGCGTYFTVPNSFGGAFNGVGGGVYAMEWTSDAIRIWFFPRGGLPADILGDNPNPSTWGTPASLFSGGCNYDNFMREHKIVFNITTCGDWAGQQNIWQNYPQCTSSGLSCKDFVSQRPEAFNEAYWLINSLKVFSQ